MASVLGIGGVFLRCADPDALLAWYARVLGFTPDEPRWHAFGHRHSLKTFGESACTVLATFPGDSPYLAPSPRGVMLNLMVDDLDGILARAAAEGVRETQPRESHSYGRFGWIMDPEGRKIELWEPAGP
jgi:catechol 2,3-dioxygenase-like lactoylglutathione lyase family enzyme